AAEGPAGRILDRHRPDHAARRDRSCGPRRRGAELGVAARIRPRAAAARICRASARLPEPDRSPRGGCHRPGPRLHGDARSGDRRWRRAMAVPEAGPISAGANRL
ncbi:MAG: hypothetical protein AVDCRST_MAG90-2593, partial [uncultured Microvirga sp.]